MPMLSSGGLRLLPLKYVPYCYMPQLRCTTQPLFDGEFPLPSDRTESMLIAIIRHALVLSSRTDCSEHNRFAQQRGCPKETMMNLRHLIQDAFLVENFNQADCFTSSHSVEKVSGSAAASESVSGEVGRSYSHENAPIQKELAAREVGNAAAFLVSPLASAVSAPSPSPSPSSSYGQSPSGF